MCGVHATTLNLLETLLTLTVEVDAEDPQGLTTFMWAAAGGHDGAMRLLFKNGAAVDARDTQGQTALFRQTRDPNPETVHLLLEAGADTNAANERGESILMTAVQKQQSGMIALLLAHGVDVNAPGRGGETPLDYAKRNRMEALAHELIQRGARSSTPIADAMGLAGRIETPDDRGWTPLGRAAREGDIGLIHLLLDAGANIEGSDADGITPLMIAVERSGEETVAALLERGAGVAAADGQGETVLHHAVRGQRLDNARAVLAAGADVDYANANGVTPLMAALKQYDSALANLFMESSAEGNIQDNLGRTALMYAVSSQNIELAQRILKAGADPSLRSNGGQNARDIAMDLHLEDLAKLLGAPENETIAGAKIIAELKPKTERIRDSAEAAFSEMHWLLNEAGQPVPRNGPGFVLDADREVDCECDVAMHRPVYRDHTGINLRVSACMRCGAVTVTESIVDEPRPHDVQCIGRVIEEIDPFSLEWLAGWPRLAWGIWQQDRRVYLTAAFRALTLEGLQAFEQSELAAQKAMGMRERLIHAGFPPRQAPSGLPEGLKSFAEAWIGLQLTEETDVERLIAVSDDRSWASPFAHDLLLRRPNIGEEVAAMLRSRDPVQFRAGKSLVDCRKVTHPAIVSAVIDLLKAAPLTEPALNPLLDTLYYLGSAAADARPILKDIAQRVGERNYYLHKRIVDIHDSLASDAELT